MHAGLGHVFDRQGTNGFCLFWHCPSNSANHHCTHHRGVYWWIQAFIGGHKEVPISMGFELFR
jgi:hypothetical protein